MDWNLIFKTIIFPALGIGLGAVLAALGTYLIRQIGKGSELPAKVESLEKSRDKTDRAINTLLTVTDHQTAGIRAVVDANKASLNGSYEKTVARLDAASEATQTFLREEIKS